MIKILEKPIIIVLIALALLSIYFGAYSPYMRSRKFIEGLRSKSTIKSLEEFNITSINPLNIILRLAMKKWQNF